MKTKKVICLILVLCVTAVFFAGCGGNDQGNSNQPSTAASQPPSGSGAAAPSGNQPQGGTSQGSAPAPQDNTVYKFNVSFAMPEFSAEEVVFAFDRIQEASNGRIEFTHYFSWSLTTVPTVIDDLNAGLVDIAMVPAHEHLNLFPLNSLIYFTPFLGIDPYYKVTALYDEMYKEWPVLAQEYAKNGVVYWTNFAMPAYNIFTTSDKNIHLPGDLRGLKLMTGTHLMQQFINANGGAPVYVPTPEYATSLSTNVVDGAINHANVLRAFGCIDFIKGGTLFGEAGIHNGLMMMLFSQQAWDKLPADLQKLFADEAVPLRDNHTMWDYNSHNGNLMAIEGAGGTLVRLTPDEVNQWAAAFSGFIDDYINELNTTGYPEARGLYEAIIAKAAN